MIDPETFETFCRNLAHALAAGFTTLVVAGWDLVADRGLLMAFGAVAVWVVLATEWRLERVRGGGRRPRH